MNAHTRRSANVMVVEDDADLRETLAERLRMEGHQVVEAADGLQALRLAGEAMPDLILLDHMLPDIPGTEVARRLAQAPFTRGVPFVMVSAKDEEIDRIVAFELGALDFVGKPFSTRELMLRVRAVLKRLQGPVRPNRMTVGPLRVDFHAHQVWVDGDEVRLSAREFDLLRILVERAGKVVSRADLVQAIWSEEADVLDRAVDSLVMRVRNRLGPAAALVQTVRGAGYRLASEDLASAAR